MDLSPADRLTRKRNMLLQKQLDVQLQAYYYNPRRNSAATQRDRALRMGSRPQEQNNIIREEYRMTRKDLDKGSKTLAEFLICLRHTAPGLQTYGQPDTRAMNAKSILLERRYELEGVEPGTDATDGNKTSSARTSKRRPQSSKESVSRTGLANEQENERGEDCEGDNADRQRASSASAYRNEFFNRRIVLDSKRRSFLQHELEKTGGASKAATKSDIPKPLPRAATHSGFYSNRDTKGEKSTRPKSSVTPRTYRQATPKYGREAETKVNEDSRKNVLGMFDVIFDPASERPNGRISSAGTTATPIYMPKEAFGPPVPLVDNSINCNLSTSNATAERTIPQNGYLLNRRVAWSAPPKRREAPPIRPTTANQMSKNNNNQANRESQSVTPRSGTRHLTITENKQRPRPKSHVPKAPRDLLTSSSGQQSPRPLTSHHERSPRRQSSSIPHGQQNGHVDLNSDFQEPRVFTRRVITQQELDIRAQRQKAMSHMMTYVGAAAKQRPKTAPQPNYELMRRSVAAPRQQVAGILAEIQSRRADTRAMLTKSKQIKTMVQTLVPDDTSPDDSFSD